MLDSFPCMNLILQCSDEIPLCQRLMFARIDFRQKVFLGNHLAGDCFAIGVVDGKKSLSKTSLAKLLVLNQIPSIYGLHRLITL